MEKEIIKLRLQIESLERFTDRVQDIAQHQELCAFARETLNDAVKLFVNHYTNESKVLLENAMQVYQNIFSLRV